MLTEEQKRDRREWYKMLKAAHMCVTCRQQDAYTLAGRARCAECAAKNAAKAKEKWERKNEFMHLQRAKLRDKWRENGLCSSCGRRKPENGKRTCARCLTRAKQRRRAKAREDGRNWPRGANGYCWICNRREVIEGMKLCQECYEVKIEQLMRRDPDVMKTMRKKVGEYNNVFFKNKRNLGQRP